MAKSPGGKTEGKRSAKLNMGAATDKLAELAHNPLARSMLAAGLVEESGERPDPALDDERRRYYRMTSLGKRVVRAEAQRLAGAVMAARAKLVGGNA